MNKKTAKEIEEEIYLDILDLAVELYKNSQLMSLEELPDLPDFKSTEESDDLFENEEKTNE